MPSETPKKRGSLSTKAPATKKPRATSSEASSAYLEANAARAPTTEALPTKSSAIYGTPTGKQNVGQDSPTKENPGEVTEVAEPRTEVAPHLPETPAPSTPVTRYLSPLERYQQIRQEQGAAREVIEGLHDFIKANDVGLPAVRARLEVKGKVVWTSSHIVKTGELARIDIVDLEAPESLEEMQKCFRDVYDSDYMVIDQLLITAAIFGCTAATPGIPPDGTIVTITNPTRVNLFMDKACQLNVRLANVTFDP